MTEPLFTMLWGNHPLIFIDEYFLSISTAGGIAKRASLGRPHDNKAAQQGHAEGGHEKGHVDGQEEGHEKGHVDGQEGGHEKYYMYLDESNLEKDTSTTTGEKELVCPDDAPCLPGYGCLKKAHDKG
jgi:hypothetical protein